MARSQQQTDDGIEKLSPSDVQADVRVCDGGEGTGCLNNFTPYRAADGSRYCITHRDEAEEAGR